MRNAGKNGPAIVPGDAEESKLYRMIAGKEKVTMPFDDKLTDAQIAAFRDWINRSAVWEGAAAAAAPASTKSLEDMEIPPEAARGGRSKSRYVLRYRWGRRVVS